MRLGEKELKNNKIREIESKPNHGLAAERKNAAPAEERH